MRRMAIIQLALLLIAVGIGAIMWSSDTPHSWQQWAGAVIMIASLGCLFTSALLRR
jgi:membrane protein YdbS with pleckstrin-like domain